ncbi:MAG TPA: hypothetical protein VMC48_03060 [Methanobacterium sp.]|nr:hypothetical protein [Methanobacterium sp.]
MLLISMFGLTKRQFLKRSKKALQETGSQVLSLRGLMNQEYNNEITLLEAQRRLDVLRRDVEETFSVYEKNSPPSNCLSLYQRILNGLILFFESIVTYSEYLQAKERSLPEENLENLGKTRENLLRYRELSLNLSREVDSYLRKN